MSGVLAVDGGQSTIRVRHSEGTTVADVSGVSRLEGDTIAAVAAAVVTGWQQVGAAAVGRAVLGLTTAPTDDAARERLCRTVAEGTGAAEVWLADDAVTSHVGALSGGWGVSVTVGTGVACLARPRDGRPRIVGGHGYLLGDEGGAWWMGREGVRAALRAHDGRGESTTLVEAAARRFGGLDDLGDRLHSLDRPVDAIARFAPDVLASAEAGDAMAAAIADAAGVELGALVRAAVDLAGAGEASVPTALGGRLMGVEALRRRLEQAIAATVPTASIRTADGSPLDGSLRLGAAAHPHPYDDLVFEWRRAA